MSKIIEENGVSVRFPDDNYMQFGQCSAYKKINSQGAKEMDVCWFDTSVNTLWLVEFKAFYSSDNPHYFQRDLSDSNEVADWLTKLTEKSIHTVAMSLTNRSLTQSCLPEIPDNNTTINVIHLVKVIPGQDTYLDPLQDKLRLRLKPYKAIFNISAISIISYDFAVKNQLLSWIV